MMAEKQFDVTAIGEVMLRYSVPVGERLERAQSLALHPGGAEANLLGSLAAMGRRCAWISGLPANPLGKIIENHLRLSNVDTKGIVWSPEGRVGTYYLEFATPPRATQVYYDRADSCAARLRPEQIDWDYTLDTRLIHLTGITPALSAAGLAVTQEAIRRAKAGGVAVSFDINYRAKLWSEKEAAAILTPLMQEVDILSCGQGDALAAGVIHGWLDGDLPRGLEYGTALAAICLSLHGDVVITTPDEVAAVMKSSGGGLNR